MKTTTNYQSLASLSFLFLLTSACVGLWSGQLTNNARAAAQNPACASGSHLTNARHFQMEATPEDFVSGDFNQDGLLDFAVAGRHESLLTGSIAILAGNGRGEFAKVYNLSLGVIVYRLATGDFNNDGKLDVAATFAGGNGGVAIAIGRGDWKFTDPIVQPAFIRPSAGVAIADFNFDGKLDIAFSGDRKLNVMRGIGDGAFAQPVGYIAGNMAPGALIANDFSGDGKPDLLVRGEEFEGKTELFINDGSGGFTAGATINAVPGGNQVFASGDLNGDGKPDLAFLGLAVIPQDRGVAIAFNNGSGGFSDPALIPDPFAYPDAITIADFNGDSKPDIATVAGFGNRAGILFGDGAGAFTSRASYNVGRFPVGLTAGDFNRDGKTDIAVINRDSNEISILSGFGDGQFQAPRATDFSIYSIGSSALADFNRDGRLDIVSALAGVQGVLVANGDGKGGFAAPKTYQAGADNNDIAVADFNKDGWLDIIAVGGRAVFPPFTNSLSLLLGSPTGDFTLSPDNLSAGQTPSTVISADFNRDGNPDIAVGNYNSNDVSFLLGDGRGKFAPAVNVAVGRSPSSFAPGDFDNDGNPDLAVANFGGTTLSILRGNGGAGFSVSSVAVNPSPVAVVAADFNNDGKLDLGVAHRDSPTRQNLSVLLGNGDASFRAPVILTTDNSVSWLTTGDFTGDGKLDLAVTQLIIGSNYSDRALIFAGDGAGNFARASELTIPSSKFPLASDLNSDGLVDLVATTQTGVSTALGACNPPPVSTLANVSAATYRGFALAPDSIAVAFGSGLATSSASAPSLPLPTELAGARVLVKDVAGVERASPLFFASPTQINYLIPPGTATGLATVTVKNGDSQTIGSLLITPTKPGIFTANADGAGAPAAYLIRDRSDGVRTLEPVVEFDPSQNRYAPRPIDFFSGSATGPDQLYLVLFGTGLRNRGSLADVIATTNFITVEVLYAGAQNELAGLDQINLRLNQLGGGPQFVRIQITVEGKTSNPVDIKFK